jgi:3-oxoacyl-[acyl-carrier protein] reductase
MDLCLGNRIVLVAGSSRGIGKATAHRFLSEGCRTVITGRDRTSLSDTQTEFETEFGSDRVMACQGDFTDSNTISKNLSKIQDRWGIPDCVVANIGSGSGMTGWELDNLDWVNLFEVNLWGSVRLVSIALPKMIINRHGSIVFISSIVGIESINAPLPYSSAKAALINYCKNLSQHTGPFNVRVNCIAPGNILFPGGTWDRHLKENSDVVMSFIHNNVPLQRFGRPEEIADLVVFLSSDRASFITGACVIIDGGQTKSV